MNFSDSIYAALALAVPLALCVMFLGVLLSKLHGFFASVAAFYYAGIIYIEWLSRFGGKGRPWFNYPHGEDQRFWTDIIATMALICGLGAVSTIPGANPEAVKEYLSGVTALSKMFVIGFGLFTIVLAIIFLKTETDDSHPLKKLRRLPLPTILDKLIRIPE